MPDTKGAVIIMTDEQTQETAVVQTRPQTIGMSGRGGLQLTGLNDMYKFAQYVAASGLAPKGMDKPEQILIALELGYEVGLQPMNAIQNIAVINGRPSIWGDAMLALVRSSGLLKKYKEEEIGTPYNDDYGYRITTVRKPEEGEDAEPLVTTFTVAKAKKAGVWGKQGPWTQYPDRMLKLRARSFNLRDAFPDALKGMIAREEAIDLPPTERDAEYDILDSKPVTRTDALAAKLGIATSHETVPAHDEYGEVTPESQPEPVAESAPTVAAEESGSEPEVTAENAGVEPAGKRPYTIGYGALQNVFLTVKELNAFIEQYGKEAVDEMIHEFGTAIREKDLEGKYKNHQKTLAASFAKKYPDGETQTGLGL